MIVNITKHSLSKYTLESNELAQYNVFLKRKANID